MFDLLLLCIILATAAAAGTFDPLQHSGPASPYFDAPFQFGIPTATPTNCVIDQAAYILRHGSRYPEPGSFARWRNLFGKFQNATYTARGPLAFIPYWTPPRLERERHCLGVDLRERYQFTKGGANFTVWSVSQQRVLDTATYFVRGYLSQGNYLAAPELNRGSIIKLPDSVDYTFANSLTPSAACPSYSQGNTGSAKANAFRANYQAKIAQRLNGFLDSWTA
ncbi:hypothetical protein D9615_006257 [Tricholomella constricta]|uniref:Phosphoglycerate mutase-like protein n=1 Tax=Tricholomella constricta TaxID=117010 RepID=A0A8H5HB72_9AGAR|nr:hypothetical protein D9615_006257 [Tricholomella constricta]